MLRLYNTLGRAVQPFEPVTPGKAGFYGCGPTVYNDAHIGNLRAYVLHDILTRTLERSGFGVTHVMNITDVGHLTGDNDEGEDKMRRSAEERGKSVLEVADFYTQAFFRDTERLNIRKPSIVCRATEHIGEMIALIRRIEENGFTYQAGGNLYFDVSKFPRYGDLALLRQDGFGALTRTGPDAGKRGSQDFVLWFTKSKFENQALTWDSPWGRGYPGWHIECSAMSIKYLGERFDIHAGGIDHIPIHHTNEIAQSEAATGVHPWVRFWVHNEFLVLDRGKMSKSSGSFLTLQSLVDAGYAPLDYRYFLLGGHYRSQLQFSFEALDGAKNARKSLREKIRVLREKAGIRGGGTPPWAPAPPGLPPPPKRGGIPPVTPPHNADRSPQFREDQGRAAAPHSPLPIPPSSPAAKYLAAFDAALEDDLNTPRALAELWGLLRDTGVPPAEALAAAFDMEKVLALGLADSAAGADTGGDGAASADAAEIEALVAERTAAKKAKDFAKADTIRDSLKGRGVILEDGPAGTSWRRTPV